MLVYPTGLINTTIYVYLSIKASLPGEASVNAYFTIMSIYGWMMWKRKDRNDLPVLQVSYSGMREWIVQLLFFGSCYGLIYWALTALQKNFAPGAIPWADALASASAYTGMWLMTRKKVESWIWWIITNTASIPLYFVKGYVFTSTYYIILLLMAISGLLEWRKKANLHRQTKSTFLN
jgi:nicotinamide mononucleotide transporter